MRTTQPRQMSLYISGCLGIGEVRGPVRPQAGHISDIETREEQTLGLIFHLLRETELSEIIAHTSWGHDKQAARKAGTELPNHVRTDSDSISDHCRPGMAFGLAFLAVGPL